MPSERAIILRSLSGVRTIHLCTLPRGHLQSQSTDHSYFDGGKRMAFRVINTARMDLTQLMRYGNGTTRLDREEAALAPPPATSKVTVNRSSARSNLQRINLRCPAMCHK